MTTDAIGGGRQVLEGNNLPQDKRLAAMTMILAKSLAMMRQSG